MGAFQAFYAGDLQGIWALLPVPALFLAYLARVGRDRAARSALPGSAFVVAYCALFGVGMLLDPIVNGPVSRAMGLSGLAASAVMFLFVWLGDFRVFWLVFGLARAPHRMARAVLWSLLVPALDLALFFGALKTWWPEVPGQVLWLLHETAFLAVALWMRSVVLPRLTEAEPAGHRRFLRCCLAYVAVYYSLWAGADVLILAGLDLGWALRVVPNQLYYAFWVPFVFFAFFGRRPEAERR